jgi:hypothetical protein
VDLHVSSEAPQTAVLLQPAHLEDNVSLSPTLTWSAPAQAISYLVEVATDANFSNIVFSEMVMGNSVDLNNLSSLYDLLLARYGR